jgi:N-acetylneuraminic acid mutarotase
VSWIDSSNNLWLFGGFGHDSAGTYGNLNDLWEYSPSSREWTWVSGSNTIAASGVYGTLGIPSIANVPGARNSAVSWIDNSGNFWLFGGNGQQSLVQDWPNDLWEFNPATTTWTWMSGSKAVDANEGVPGTYGTLGVPALTNVPGGRSGALSWKTKDGNFWLFGGDGYDSTGTSGDLNDLWRYQP